MHIEFEVSDLIPATPQEVYKTWLDSAGHSAMTGSPAQVSDVEGESFTAWDGYILGRNLELEPPSRILQSWRTTQFDDLQEDSLLEIQLMAIEKSTLVTIRHSRLLENGMQYRQGWIDFYFTPMKEYFGKNK